MSDLNEIEKGQLCQSTIESLNKTATGLRQFPGMLKRIIETRAWESRMTRGRVIELSSLRELITAKPIDGWGEDIRKVENVIKDDAECLAMFREAIVEKPGKRAKASDFNSDNVTNKTSDDRGNARAYSISRVQRECAPEVVKEVMAGKLSPNAALVQAGLRENRQVYIPKDPAKAVEKLQQAFGAEFVSAMAEHVLAKVQ